MNGDNSTISGTVTDDNGTPLGGVSVSAVQGQEETASTTTASDGSYSMPFDPSLESVVTFRLAGYVTYITNTDAGAPLQSLDATLQRERA
jgi:protocatechuate 3,4-dioxygenase beta subunit